MNASAADWFAAHGWEALDFQRQAWAAYRAGESGLRRAFWAERVASQVGTDSWHERVERMVAHLQRAAPA